MENHTSDYRVEKDSIGTKDVPANVYYGVQSLRAAENFPITGLRMNPELIRSLAYIKKAAALTNLEAGLLNERIANAIVRACDEILAGKLREQFIVDPVQGGAGTSINMNANEVIANRAIVTGQSVRKLILQEKLLTEEEIDTILDPMNLTKPGIPGKELLAHK